MPIYEYRCHNGHTLEVRQRMSDDPLASCTACDAPVQRVFHPVAVHFRGSGFYSTDYAKKGAKDPDERKPKADSDSKPASSTDSSTGSAESGGSGSKAKTAPSETKSAS